jgi:leucyl aminopeptidase
MQITVETQKAIDVRTAMLVLLVPKLEDAQWRPPPRAAAVDRALGGRIAAVIASGDFRGKSGESLLLYPNAEIPAERVQLLGLGEEGKLSAESVRCLAGRAVNAARDRRASSIAIYVPRVRGMRLPEITQALAEGLILASYQFDTYSERKKDAAPSLKRASLLIDRPADLKAARGASRTGVVLAESQNLCRQLSNEPANALPPAKLANAAKRMAKEVGLSARVMDVAELKKRRMGGILAVGGGSANTPRLIVLDHDPRSSRAKKGAKSETASIGRLPTVCLVGKGITFDSGGISIKPSAAMDEMKHDMSGAAAVIGALRACALLKLPIRVVGVIAAAENMPSSTAYRPGDIVTTMSGKTVEVLNTDAEGRSLGCTPQGCSQRCGRHQEHDRPRRLGIDRRGIPRKFRGRHALGPPGYCGYGLEQQVIPLSQEGSDRRGRPAARGTATGLEEEADRLTAQHAPPSLPPSQK